MRNKSNLIDLQQMSLHIRMPANLNNGFDVAGISLKLVDFRLISLL